MPKTKKMPNRAVFLDRDGTVNEDLGYICNPNDVRLLRGSAEAIRSLNQAGWLVVLVSNQSGIGRGLFDEAALTSIQERLNHELAQTGAHIDATFYCPHAPGDNCRCRKPNPGLLKRAASDFGIDLCRSWMVGDKVADVEAGRRAGCRTALVLTGHGEAEATQIDPPSVVAPNLLAIVQQILQERA